MEEIPQEVKEQELPEGTPEDAIKSAARYPTIEHKLDAVLEYLEDIGTIDFNVAPKKRRPEFVERLEWTGVQIRVNGKTGHRFGLLIDKLLCDGFIQPREGFIPAYEITVEGLMFEGYVNEKNRLDFEYKRDLRRAEQTFLLTLILALGASVASAYYFLEIVGWFYGF